MGSAPAAPALGEGGQRGRTKRMARALLINTAFLGDVIFSLPAVEALGALGYTVDLLTRPGYGQLARGLVGFGAALDFDKRGRQAGAPALWRLGATLRARRYDAVLGAHPSARSGLLAALSGAPVRLGWGPVGYTRRVPRGPQFVADALQLVAQLAQAAGRPMPPVAPVPRLAMEGLQIGVGLPQDAVLLVPGARWATKRWPVAHWRALAGRLRAQGLTVWAVGGPDERALCEAIGAEGIFCERDLWAAAGLFSRARAVVGGDSGLVHLALAAGARALMLFGPTSAQPHPAHPRRIDLGRTDLGCRPCSAHGPARCPLGHHACMQGLSVERVHEGLQRWLRG